MPITVHCECGKSFNVPEVYAGKRIKCPTCAGSLVVPEAQEEDAGRETFLPVPDVVAPPPQGIMAGPGPSRGIERATLRGILYVTMVLALLTLFTAPSGGGGGVVAIICLAALAISAPKIGEY
jgi:hypothetical protein